MDRQCEFCDDTKNYLKEFNCILEKMILGMTNTELTDSISHNFIVQMIPHHMAAVEMSKNILKYTDNKQLCNIASEIIDEQTKNIENMREIECLCEELKNSDRDLCLYKNRMNCIMNIMFSAMKNACVTDRIDCNFMWEMIPHHRGAVEMSENTLRFNICKDLKPILCEIIRTQKKGIMQMQNLLRCTGC